MRKFLGGIFLFVLFAFVLPAILAFSLPSNPNGYLMEYGRKVERLRTVQGKRLILMGGSDVAYNVNSAYLEKTLGRKVINCGLLGGLGNDFYLNDLLRYARPGDVILYVTGISLSGLNGDYTSFTPLVDYFPEVFLQLNAYNKLEVVKGSYWLLKNKLTYLYARLEGSDDAEGGNGLAHFNKYGDESYHWKDTTRHLFGPLNKNVFHRYGVKYIADRLQVLRDRGCKVFMMPNLIQDKSYGLYKDAFSEEEAMYRKAGFRYLIEPSELVVNDSMLYDVAVHANYRGVMFYSKMIAARLGKYLGQDSMAY